MEAEIRLFEPDMWEDLCGFIRVAYKPDYFMLDRRYFDWWNRDSPSNWEDRYRLVVATYGNKIVGMFGQIANTFRIRGKIYRGTWYSNGIVHPEYRGLGIGKKLWSGATQFTPVAAEIGGNAAGRALYRVSAFETFGQRRMHRAIYLLQPESVAEHLPCSDPALIKKIKECNLEQASSLLEEAVSPMSELSPALEALWDKVKDRYVVTTERTLEHIMWRYVNHPRGHYHLIAHYENGASSALGVIRFESRETTRVCRIADIWGLPEAITPLLRKIIANARQNGAILIDFFCTNWPDRSAFEEAGFYILNENEASFLPYLFSPLELRQGYNEYIGMWTRDPDVIKGISFEDIYFVRGDADRDRPQ